MDEAEKVINSFVSIENQMDYRIYTSGRPDFYNQTEWSGAGYGGLTDSFMTVSDFNKICEPLGFEPLQLEDEYVVIANLPEALRFDYGL